jgi:hypothetical protein
MANPGNTDHVGAQHAYHGLPVRIGVGAGQRQVWQLAGDTLFKRASQVGIFELDVKQAHFSLPVQLCLRIFQPYHRAPVFKRISRLEDPGDAVQTAAKAQAVAGCLVQRLGQRQIRARAVSRAACCPRADRCPR